MSMKGADFRKGLKFACVFCEPETELSATSTTTNNNMGISESSQSQPENCNVNSPSHAVGTSLGVPLRTSKHHSTVQSVENFKMPMPERSELERRFTKVLVSMDLPPDKAKVLKQYDDEKKWDMICDQEKVIAKEPPAYYLKKLKTYLDPKASRSSRRRRLVGDATSTQNLRDLEISLRTNNIEWVREFLNEDNKGLDVLVDYLSFRLMILRHEHLTHEASIQENGSVPNGYSSSTTHRPALELDNFKIRRASKHISKLNMGEATDDIHVCVMCLRAIMNNKNGFNMVFEHREAINCITLSLTHKKLRTKALVLELLAAICLVKGGHHIILKAFSRFKEVTDEEVRFKTLMDYFMNYDEFNIDFMVACMQFINIVVHSVEDVNFRVHLQYEFTQLGLDEYLEKLRHCESEELQVQISAYLDNVFDVVALMEDSETKNAALDALADIEQQLSRVIEEKQEIENELNARLVELETSLENIVKEKTEMEERLNQMDEEMNTLRQENTMKEEESRQRQSMLESKLVELETLQNSLPRGSTKSELGKSPSVPVPPPAPAPPPPVAPPPPPPPPPIGCNKSSNAPPPPPGQMPCPENAMTIKKKYEPKYKLPSLNWIALKPNQVKGTVFNELDDEKLYKVIDFVHFEEQFKLSQRGGFYDQTDETLGSKRFKVPEKVTLLEHTRLRNIAISSRKMELNSELLVRAINNFDLKVLSHESVEILQRMVPNEKEVKAYREYERQKKPFDALTDEDKFLLQLTKVERLSQKLNILNYIYSFSENVQLTTPQVHALITASRSIKSSTRIRKLLEVILAFGNYMNSAKRGPAYGFKLQSLDSLGDTKSADRKISLLHYIVDCIHYHFPDISSFDMDLRFVEKAAGVSLENILTDVQELEKGLELCKKELALRGDSKDIPVLKEFIANNQDKLKKLQADTKTAQETYSDCIEFFGESARTVAPNTFFSVFVRFVKAFKQAELDNENRRRQEQAAKQAKQMPQENTKNNPHVRRNTQEAMINELKSKTKQVKEQRLMKQDEVYHGALEDIILDLKNKPYRRADAVRRSQRRKQENIRPTHAAEHVGF